MVHYYQGGAENIKFCLMTTGINVDPHNGLQAREYQEYVKNVISQRAEIVFEHYTIREISDVVVNTFLEGYSDEPRVAYQFLFGCAEHSYGWTIPELVEQIDSTPFPRSIDPQDGEYSIDFIGSKNAGMTMFQDVFIGPGSVWAEKIQFYYTYEPPGFNAGDTGDIHFVPDPKTSSFELYYKPAFKWVKLFDHLLTQSPIGEFFVQTTPPTNQPNSWWLDHTNLSIRKYSKQLNIWEPQGPLTVSETEPVGPSIDDLWLEHIQGKFTLYIFTTVGWVKAPISQFAVQDRDTNSAFVGTPGDNNFVFDCDDPALNGGPIKEGEVKIFDEGNFVGTFSALNFKGVDLQATASITPGRADIEHFPVTQLPEQTLAPVITSDAGTIYSFEINGVTELFYIDDVGNITQLTNNGSLTQNIFLATSTTSAVAGQTVFSLPSSTKEVLTLKVNGVDTIHWSFTFPSVTYFPIAADYVIEAGDVITTIYYA